ncbi:unnamed protein product [Arctia plantaginis]|uniref:Protein sleepless n=1 Tax=Arctia plantaginis TaxID=874455 RepID=A0A8S0ZHK7_ARCPL|nr:unnamed protein product [Arctia plantaginis]
MNKQNENLFREKFRLLNSQEHSEDIKWSSTSSSEPESTILNNNVNEDRRRNRKRKRKKNVLKNISNLDITFIDSCKNEDSCVEVIYNRGMEMIANCGRNSLIFTAVFTLFWIKTVHSIDCFKCVSMNGRFPACDDPFHNNHSLQMLESPCMGGRKGRDGLFPATSCIKIAGVFHDTGETITVRGCGLDSGTATTDTEIIRMSHCGRFYYDERYVHGCLQSCNDADACNSSNNIKSYIPSIVTLYALLSLLRS